MFEGKRVLVTGGTGMIGRQLVELLLARGAKVRVASLDDPSRAHPAVEFVRRDLSQAESCRDVCEGMHFVFHLMGVKGSPAMTAAKPATFFVPVLLCNTHMMEAARQAGVEWYLYTSTIGVYQPAEVLREDDVWKTMPSPNDWFSGWAKRMGELQADAYRKEYGWDRCSIVRPANVYGPYDNFDPTTGMVIPSLIRRAVDGEDPFTVWGDGSPVRDFIHARDVARGMMFAVENKITEPLNLGSGTGVSIRELVEVVVANMERKPKVAWDPTKPAGDKRRVMDMSRAHKRGFRTETTIEAGVREVMAWYRENRAIADRRYNPLAKKES